MTYTYDPQKITYFAATDARGKKTPFGIKAIDRMRHMYVIGKSGVGKSTMLENLAIQDIQNGEGICFIDPHGGTAEKLLEYVPENRVDDVMYFAPFDTEYPVGFNIMEDVGRDKRHLVVAGLMSAFRRIWVDAWSARMEYFLQNALLALLEYPDATLMDVNQMFINKKFRAQVVDNLTDPIVKRFWTEEFAGMSDRYVQEATPAIQNKLGQFTANPLVRNIVGQAKSTFDVRDLMDNNKILIVNLSKGRMGEQNADLLGSILTTKIYLAAMSREEESAAKLKELPPFYLYVDEFQSVVNDSFANILSEARKYKLALIIANQYMEQIPENVRAAVFGNAGSIVTFRVGPFDAEVMKTIFEPVFYAEDLVNLGFAQIYLTMMIDGMGSQPFSATTLPPVDEPPFSFVQKIVEASRNKYAYPRTKVEAFIARHNTEIEDEKAKNAAAQDKKKSFTPNRKGNVTGQRNTDAKFKKQFDKPNDRQQKPEPTNDDLRNTLQKLAGTTKKALPSKKPTPQARPQAPTPVKPPAPKQASSAQPKQPHVVTQNTDTRLPKPPSSDKVSPSTRPQKETQNHISLREAVEQVRPAGQVKPTPIKPINQTQNLSHSVTQKDRSSNQKEIPEKTLRDILRETK